MASHPMINKKNIRRFILDYAKRSRAHTYSRVAECVYDQIESAMRDRCRRIVDAQPSAGRTIK